jgi:hypothetical protein
VDIERSGSSERLLAVATARDHNLDGGVRMTKRVFLAMASLAALVLSSGAGVSWLR